MDVTEMTSEQILAEIKEANLTYLMLAQSLIRQDKPQALFRLGISEESADLLETLSPAQVMKLASGNMLLCRFRADDNMVWSLLTNHNLQGRTGILAAATGLEQLAGPTTDAGLEMSRRTELQADCLSGMFVRSVARSIELTQDDVTELNALMANLADPAGKVGNHGQEKSRQQWFFAGYGSDKVSTCNTFIAPADQVE